MTEKEQVWSVYIVEEKIKATSIEAWNVVYVGSSIHVQNRWAEHCKVGFSGRPMTDAILARGIDSFRCRVVGEYDTKELACNVENALMVAYDTFMPNGYNQRHAITVTKKNIVKRDVNWTQERRDAASARMTALNEKRHGKK